jgi:hypothetical protein
MDPGARFMLHRARDEFHAYRYQKPALKAAHIKPPGPMRNRSKGWLPPAFGLLF